MNNVNLLRGVLAVGFTLALCNTAHASVALAFSESAKPGSNYALVTNEASKEEAGRKAIEQCAKASGREGLQGHSLQRQTWLWGNLCSLRYGERLLYLCSYGLQQSRRGTRCHLGLLQENLLCGELHAVGGFGRTLAS